MGHGKMHGMGMRGHYGMEHGRMFHRWGDFLTTHREELGLTDEQLDKVDSIFGSHTKDAIRKNAERKILRMEVRDLLLKEKIDLVEVEKKLRALEALETGLRMDGVRALDQALNTLTPEQRKKALALFKERVRPGGTGMMRGPMRMRGQAAMTERMRCMMGSGMMGE
jgi:Spy/CpxP family protein refolding chaperone